MIMEHYNASHVVIVVKSVQTLYIVQHATL